MLLVYLEWVAMATARGRGRPVRNSVTMSDTAFEHVYGAEIFEYFVRHPEEAAIFDAAMTSRGGQGKDAVVSADDFSGIGAYTAPYRPRELGHALNGPLSKPMDGVRPTQADLYGRPRVGRHLLSAPAVGDE